MSKAKELIESLKEYQSTVEANEAAEINENKLVTAHDSHYGHERAVGMVRQDKHSKAHKAYHIAYPNSINNPRELGSFPSHEEAAKKIKETHKEFENHPRYAKHYKK